MITFLVIVAVVGVAGFVAVKVIGKDKIVAEVKLIEKEVKEETEKL